MAQGRTRSSLSTRRVVFLAITAVNLLGSRSGTRR
jgi:hypothetical protein